MNIPPDEIIKIVSTHALITLFPIFLALSFQFFLCLIQRTFRDAPLHYMWEFCGEDFFALRFTLQSDLSFSASDDSRWRNARRRHEEPGII